MPAPGSQHDLNTGSVGPAQGIQVGVGHLDLGVQQRAIYINGDEANAALHELILAAVRYRLVNGRGFQPKHGEATNGKLFYKVFVAGGAGGCRIANNRVDCGPATAVAFRYGLPLLSRVLCRSQRQVQPDAMASLGDEYAGSTLACSRSFLPSDSACAGPGRWLGQCAYAHCLCR